MNKIKAVIIDDEHFNRGLIRMLITKLNASYAVMGEAENIKEGFDLILKEKPNVVFLDIKMQDGSGFDLLGLFNEIEFEIVFVTGFDEYTLKAFEMNAMDYVLKPIDLDKFRETLDRVEARISHKNKDTLKVLSQKKIETLELLSKDINKRANDGQN
jgi:two-component system LytT family response regulator